VSPENQLTRAKETLNHGELGFRAAGPGQAYRDECFHAVHISSCGKHLAILTLSNKVILIQDFWKLVPVLSYPPSASIPSPITLGNTSKQVDFQNRRLPWDPVGRLAYNRGRVAVVSVHGAYVLVLDSILDQLGGISFPPKDISLQMSPRSLGHEQPWPNLRLCEVRFGDGDVEISSRRTILCLELTETRLYFSVFPGDINDERGENMWGYDFSSSSSPM